MNISKGKLLISKPFSGDPNFERTVTLLCEHNENGSFGLTLNQTTSLTISDVFPEEVFADLPLFLGGPVQQNTLHYIHRLGNIIEETVEIAENLYWSGNFEQIKTLINIGKIHENDIRFFMGYAGWSQGQLQDEFNQDTWIMTDADTDFIFSTPADQFWRGILKKMDGNYKAFANYPIDPRLN